MTDLTLLYGNASLVRVTATLTAPDGTIGPYDLTGAAIAFTVTRPDATTVVYTDGAGVTVIPPPSAGVLEIRLDGDDFPTPGELPYTLDVTPPGSDDPDTVLYGSLVVTRHPDPDVAAMRLLVGPGVPPADAELASAYARLGSHKAVALEVLEARYVALASGPTSWKIDGHYSEERGDLKELAAVIERFRHDVAVESGEDSATMTVSYLERADRAR